jgi:hypothetical protein
MTNEAPDASARPGALYGVDLFGHSAAPRASGPVVGKFLFPPFSLLDARSGEWQERKRAWLALGITGQDGRDAELFGFSANLLRMQGGYFEDDGTKRATADTSVFDPALCEAAYRWFCPPSGQVLDPFAGGSVRGIVAALLGLQYWGCDLREEQIYANRKQADSICGEIRPVWVCGDSIETLEQAPAADFVFSCPPYGDLEIYSDDPRDLSRMEWHTFSAAYKRIVWRSLGRLREDRFACFVVGDFRDERGFYRNFVSMTIQAFEECGARLYNEAILSTIVGTAAMRVTKQFDASRKMAKTHQNVLVFCKGDPRRAAKACAPDVVPET